MLRKIAAGTSAAVVAAGLAASPAMASGLPGAGADACSGVAHTEQSSLPPQSGVPFLFGPLAEVPHLLSGDRDCFALTSAAADTSAARRGSKPPAVGTPIPDVPSGPPPGDSLPVDSAPPPPAPAPAPPVQAPVPEPPPMTAPPPPAPAERGPAEAVRPPVQPPERAPQRLPQTATDSRPLTVAGGASLAAAGLAWIGGARRRRKRPAGPADR